MSDDLATASQDSTSRQIYAYFDGAAHNARYARAIREQPGAYFRIDLPTVLGTVALLPFVQALGSALGTTAGEKTAEGVRSLARKVLRRELTSATQPGQDRPDAPSIAGVARIQFDEDLPAEALLLLPTMDFTPLGHLGEHPPVVRWLTDGKWHAVTLREGRIVDAAWDTAETRWCAAEEPDEWGEARRRRL
ncbi:hypothetical protein [Streptomyces sp. NPDC058266]|uniref:hypothetical protein n=1 Tax=Streptomyces sp. NPDC058266 TaxID=3346412 RepID=UPI0036E3354A